VLVPLLILKPCATVMCIRSGTPGGLFTPSLTLGALLGGTAGYAVMQFVPETSLALCALLGAGAVVAATTQGSVSAVVLLMELTGRDRSFIAPLLLAVTLATLVSRTIEPRSIYDARLTDEEIKARLIFGKTQFDGNDCKREEEFGFRFGIDIENAPGTMFIRGPADQPVALPPEG
jgi:chloride channel protein, CIC family